MREGWILYRRPQAALSPEAYEVHRLVEEGEALGIRMRVLAPEQVDLVVTREDSRSVLVDGSPTELPDFLLPRMGAATTYFGLAVIRHLERLGVPTVNESVAIETVKDKLWSHQILAASNLPIAKTMLAKFPIDFDAVERLVGFPLVLKTLSGSQGQGVFLCESKSNLQDLGELMEATKANLNIVLQEFIESSHGRDLRVMVVGGRTVAAMERRSNDGSFKANVSRGGSAREIEITPEVDWLACEVARILGLSVAGIDLLFDGDHFRVCEANSSPGFEGLERACDINMPREIFAFVAVRSGNLEFLSKMARTPAVRPVNNPRKSELAGSE